MIRVLVSKITDGVVRLFSGSGGGENFAQREFLQQYGFSSTPKPGAELVVMVDGNVITAIGSDDRRYRIALLEGEVALWDDLGQKVHLTRDGIVAKSSKRITADAPEVNLGGDRSSLKALIDERILALINAHTHNGVQAGSGVSGAMVKPITSDQVCTQKTKAA